MLDQNWFQKYQNLLTWFANTLLGNLVFGFYLNETKPNKISRIGPNFVEWKVKETKKKTFIEAEFLGVNQYADRLRLFLYPILYPLHLWDILIANRVAPQFNLGYDTLEVNPNAGGDGGNPLTNATYSTVHDASDSAGAQDTQTTVYTPQNGFNAGTYYINRGFWPFDTSSLPDAATISAAVLAFYCDDKHDTDTESVTIVQSTQASNTALVAGDYDQVGTTSGGATALSAITLNQYNDITLNATGRGWISKTGYTPLATRMARDISNTAPTGGNDVDVYTSNNASNKPKLTITYSTTAVKKVSSVAQASIKKISGIAIASVKKIAGIT